MLRTFEGMSQRFLERGQPNRFLYEAAPYLTQSPTRFLDVGCASGRNAIAAAKLGYEVTATDLFDETLAFVQTWAKDEGVSVTTARVDMDDASAMKSLGQFPVVLSSYSLQYRGREAAFKAVDTLKDLTTPEGHVMILARVAKSEREWQEMVDAHHYYFRPDELQEQFLDWNIIVADESPKTRPLEKGTIENRVRLLAQKP